MLMYVQKKDFGLSVTFNKYKFKLTNCVLVNHSKFTFLFKYIWVYLLHPHIFGYYVTISGQTSYAKSITIVLKC